MLVARRLRADIIRAQRNRRVLAMALLLQVSCCIASGGGEEGLRAVRVSAVDVDAVALLWDFFEYHGGGEDGARR